MMSHSTPVRHDVPDGYMTDRGLHILRVSTYDSIGLPERAGEIVQITGGAAWFLVGGGK